MIVYLRRWKEGSLVCYRPESYDDEALTWGAENSKYLPVQDRPDQLSRILGIILESSKAAGASVLWHHIYNEEANSIPRNPAPGLDALMDDSL